MRTATAVLALLSLCGLAAGETYPIAPMTVYEPATIRAEVTLQNGSLLIRNAGAAPWRDIRLYAQCLDEPTNFNTRLPIVPAHGEVRVSLASFRRGPVDGHGPQCLDGGKHGEIDDLLIVCRCGPRQGRWYGMAHGIRTTHINVFAL